MKSNCLNSILIFLIISITTSCNKEHLERDFAAKEIRQQGNFPKPMYYEFFNMYLKDYKSVGMDGNMNVGTTFAEVKDMMIFFQNKGLITLRDETKSESKTVFLLGTTTRTWIYTHIELTELGKEHLVSTTKLGYKVKLWEKDFDQINGIKELYDQKLAEVDYQMKNVNITPFGDYFSDRLKVENRSAAFTLYDNGWKLN